MSEQQGSEINEAVRNFPDAAEFEAADSVYESVPSFNQWLTDGVDISAWDVALKLLDTRRQRATSEDLRRSIEIAMRAAAVDTGAIEGLYEADRGFTFSVALQNVAWQAAMAEKGPEVRDLFDAQLRAYELALDVATQRLPITEVWLRRLHQEICSPQKTVRVLTDVGWQEQTFEKGTYKTVRNHVITRDGTIHAYAPVLSTPAEMHQFVEQLNSAQFSSAHPVEQAAYAHYGLVRIHPFQDGNGRVARALASVFLYRAASIPLVVFADQKQLYFDALEHADAGRHSAFTEFVLDRSVDALQLVADQIDAAPEPELAELRTLLTSHGGLTHSEVDQIGFTVHQGALKEFTSQVGRLRLPPGVTLNVQEMQSGLPVATAEGPDYRPLHSRGTLWIGLFGGVQAPAQAQLQYVIRVLAARKPGAMFAFRIRVEAKGDEKLDVRLSEVRPDLTAAFSLKVSAWIGHILRMALTELAELAEKALKGSGY